MSSSTVLYVEVPIEGFMLVDADATDTLQRRGYLKRHWHEHINAFSRNSLWTLVETAGFEVLDLVQSRVALPGRADNHMWIFQLLARPNSA